MAENEESKNFINLGVVRNQKGKVLMIKRRKEETGRDGTVLKWAFPAGKQRFDETREECVKREVLAETGYQVNSIRQLAMKIHPQFPIMIVYHLCELVSPQPVAEPSEPHEVAEVKWVKPEQIRKLITTELNPEVAKELGI